MGMTPPHLRELRQEDRNGLVVALTMTMDHQDAAPIAPAIAAQKQMPAAHRRRHQLIGKRELRGSNDRRKHSTPRSPNYEP